MKRVARFSSTPLARRAPEKPYKVLPNGVDVLITLTLQKVKVGHCSE